MEEPLGRDRSDRHGQGLTHLTTPRSPRFQPDSHNKADDRRAWPPAVPIPSRATFLCFETESKSGLRTQRRFPMHEAEPLPEQGPDQDVLFYPFHLCHPHTLKQLLMTYQRVHFRDYMAIQLSPVFGTTAHNERMGDAHPELVAEGRLVQGYQVSGPLSPETIASVNEDLADTVWRDLFHTALATDRRFQHGLFGTPTGTQRPWDSLGEDQFRTERFSVAQIRRLSEQFGKDAPLLDYGLALLKTSAALVYTGQLAATYQWHAVTDSPAHGRLFQRHIERERLEVEHGVIERSGY